MIHSASVPWPFSLKPLLFKHGVDHLDSVFSWQIDGSQGMDRDRGPRGVDANFPRATPSICETATTEGEAQPVSPFQSRERREESIGEACSATRGVCPSRCGRGALHCRVQLLGDRAGNKKTNVVASNIASHAPRWLLQCCQSSETHHVNLIRHHCSREVLRQPPKPRRVLDTLQKRDASGPRLRRAWPPSHSSRICRGPDRTTHLLAERGDLTEAPQEQEAASLDPGGLTMWHQILAPTRLLTSHPIARVLPLDRHAVRGRPRVSTASTRGEPNVLQQNQRTEPFDQPTRHPAGVCATTVVATRTASTLSLPPGHPWLQLCVVNSAAKSTLSSPPPRTAASLASPLHPQPRHSPAIAVPRRACCPNSLCQNPPP